MAKKQLQYRMHDPNPPGVTADFLLGLFLEVNRPAAEEIIRQALCPASPPELGEPAKQR